MILILIVIAFLAFIFWAMWQFISATAGVFFVLIATTLVLKLAKQIYK